MVLYLSLSETQKIRKALLVTQQNIDELHCVFLWNIINFLNSVLSHAEFSYLPRKNNKLEKIPSVKTDQRLSIITFEKSNCYLGTEERDFATIVVAGDHFKFAEIFAAFTHRFAAIEQFCVSAKSNG